MCLWPFFQDFVFSVFLFITSSTFNLWDSFIVRMTSPCVSKDVLHVKYFCILLCCGDRGLNRTVACLQRRTMQRRLQISPLRNGTFLLWFPIKRLEKMNCVTYIDKADAFKFSMRTIKYLNIFLLVDVTTMGCDDVQNVQICWYLASKASCSLKRHPLRIQYRLWNTVNSYQKNAYRVRNNAFITVLICDWLRIF